MIPVIEKLHKLVEEAEIITKNHAQKTQELQEREALCANKEKDLDLRKQNLDSREALLVPIENMTQWKADVQVKEAKVNEERATLEADKKKWATQVQADKSQIENDRAISKREADNNERNRKNLEGMAKDRAKEILAQFGHADLAGKI